MVMPAPFQNLDFEEYNPATWLVPGWTFEMTATPFGGSQVLTRLPLDYGVNGPFSPNPPYATIYSKAHKPFGFPADSGNYLVGLVPLVASQLYPWYLRQAGEIPADAKSMSFEVGGAQVSLKLNGREVPLEYFSVSNVTLAGTGGQGFRRCFGVCRTDRHSGTDCARQLRGPVSIYWAGKPCALHSPGQYPVFVRPGAHNSRAARTGTLACWRSADAFTLALPKSVSARSLSLREVRLACRKLRGRSPSSAESTYLSGPPRSAIGNRFSCSVNQVFRCVPLALHFESLMR